MTDAKRTRGTAEHKSPPQVLILSDYYLPAFVAGGPIRALANMVQQVGDRISFSVLTRDRDLGCNLPLPGVNSREWLAVGKAKVLYLSPRYLLPWRFGALLCSLSYNVLYLNGFFSVPFTIQTLAIRRLGGLRYVSVLVAPRGMLSESALSQKPFRKRLFISLAKQMGLFRGIVWQATSEGETQDIRAVLGKSVRVVIAPDCVALPSNLQRQKKNTNTLRVIFLSRVCYHKNLHYALEMVRSLQGHVEFTIAGPKEDSIYWRRCETIIEGLPENIRIVDIGAVQPPYIPRLLAQHDLFFLPTRSENFGHALFEALAAGCPVLTSDQTPWTRLEEFGAGWQLSLDDPDAFTRILTTCLEMGPAEHTRMSQSARKYAEAYSKTNSCEGMLQVLGELLFRQHRHSY